MKNKIKFLLSVILMFTLLFSQLAYGQANGSGHANGRAGAYGQLKKLENYESFDGNRIMVRNRHVNFDVQPVIMGNRTLIPVRAVTEALGCKVSWIAPKAYVVSPDESTIIVFDLSTSEVFVTENWSLENLQALTDESIWDALEVDIDVAPGLLENRTFVPLRFIAEILGLNVYYDDDSGEIDINDEPELLDSSLTIEEETLLPDSITIDFVLNDFEFVGIDGLILNTDYVYSIESKVILLKSYIDSIDEEVTDLTFNFEKGTTTVTLDYTLTLDYMNEKPELVEDSITVDLVTSLPEIIQVDFNLNDYEFVDIDNLILNTDYIVSSDSSIILLKSYIDSIDEEVTDLNFNFKKDDMTVILDYKITLEYIDVLATLEASTSSIDNDTEDLSIVFDISLNDYTFLQLKNDTEILVQGSELDNEDYFVSEWGDEITLHDSYLETLAVGDYTFSFEFSNGSDDQVIDFELEITE